MSISDIINVRKDLEVVSLRQLAPDDGSAALSGKGIEGLLLWDSGDTTETDIYLDLNNSATSGTDYEIAQTISGLGWSSCVVTSPIMTGSGTIDILNSGDLVCVGGTMATNATLPTVRGLMVSQNTGEMSDILFDLDDTRFDEDSELKNALEFVGWWNDVNI